MSKHQSNEDFFVRLSELFEARRKAGHGSIFLSQKCMSYNTTDATTTETKTTATQPFPDLLDTTPQPIIIRATDGKSGLKGEKKGDKIKLSTIVQADDLEEFFVRYADVCKGGMSALKKRDRSKKKKKEKKRKVIGGEVEAKK